MCKVSIKRLSMHGILYTEANLGAELTGSAILTSETIDKPLASDNLQLVMQASANHKSTLTCLLPTPIGRVYIIGKSV